MPSTCRYDMFDILPFGKKTAIIQILCVTELFEQIQVSNKRLSRRSHVNYFLFKDLRQKLILFNMMHEMNVSYHQEGCLILSRLCRKQIYLYFNTASNGIDRRLIKNDIVLSISRTPSCLFSPEECTGHAQAQQVISMARM